MTGDGSWLIRGVTIPGHSEQPTSILIAGGSVTAIGPALDHPGARTLDAGGLIALPGLVDLHTHLREPGREDAETVETGTAAAALGGYTAVHAMANTDPVADTAGVVEQVWRLGRTAGTATSSRWVPLRSASMAPGWPSSARWRIRPPGSGCSPTMAGAVPGHDRTYGARRVWRTCWPKG